MSAIWGIIDFHHTLNVSSFASELKAFYNDYTYDRLETQALPHAFFACCHQHLTPEAAREALPFHDSKRNILFTADCILDNRTELFSDFPELLSDTPDGLLLYHAYLKWGRHLGDHVLGAFTFVAYHYAEGTATLWTDHMSHRSLYYTFRDHTLYFSTLAAPLAKALHAVPCEQWLAGCLATTSADMMLYEGLTPYETVYQVNAARTVSVNADGVSEREYWSPLKLRPTLHFTSMEDAQKKFLTVFTDCIRSVLRSTGNTGCTLSSGLDSSSVACLTASLFMPEQKTLYSYTSVPLASFSADSSADSSYHIYDETPGVTLLCKHYPNIRPAFLSCEGKDAFSELSRLVPLIGYPMKSGHNLTWLDAIYHRASADGCKLMLKGQFGNSTVSYGPALTVIYQKLCNLHPVQAYRIMTEFGKKYHVPRKTILRFMAKEFRGKFTSPSLREFTVLTKPELQEKYNIAKTIKNNLRSSGGGQMDSRKQRLSFLFSSLSLAQLGMFDTAMGLLHGLLIRDPTKDKRLVEFCASVPVEYCLAGSLERGMLRTFMQGIVPDKILLDVHHRGLQSADYAHRSRLLWEKQKTEVLSTILTSNTTRYADRELVYSTVQHMQTTDIDTIELQDFITTNVLYSCSLFLNQLTKENP